MSLGIEPAAARSIRLCRGEHLLFRREQAVGPPHVATSTRTLSELPEAAEIAVILDFRNSCSL